MLDWNDLNLGIGSSGVKLQDYFNLRSEQYNLFGFDSLYKLSWFTDISQKHASWNTEDDSRRFHEISSHPWSILDVVLAVSIS